MGGRISAFEEIVGCSEEMRSAERMICKIAASDATVLITGESGTGKELIARAVHTRSHRRERRFVPVDCGALCAQLMESELFGHVRGAFTGAPVDKPGIVESAEGGTLFLDEIGNLDLVPQQKLLRVLECGEYRSLGGVPVRQANVRVIAATNRNLQQDVQEGRFRKDLFYRLNHFHVHLPPLRNRKEDIPLLIEHFLGKTCESTGQTYHEIEPAALEAMITYPWPGNVRELAHAVEYLILMSEGPCLRYQDLPESLRNTHPGDQEERPWAHDYRKARQQALDAFNVAYIANTLRWNGGNVTLAARQGGLRRQSFQGLMRRYNIQSKDYRPSTSAFRRSLNAVGYPQMAVA